MKYSVLSLCLAFLSLACGGGGGSEVSMGQVNGVDVTDASFSIFNVRATPIDSDNDGVDDLDLAELQIIVSDEANLCDQLNNVGLENILNIKYALIVVFKAVSLGEGLSAFAANDQLLSNQFVINFIQDNLVQNDTFVDTIVQVIENGDKRIDASGLGFVDIDEISDSELFLSEFTANTSLSAEFSITLGGDVADPNQFDTDANADNQNDYRLINVPLSIDIVNASFCGNVAPF